MFLSGSGLAVGDVDLLRLGAVHAVLKAVQAGGGGGKLGARLVELAPQPRRLLCEAALALEHSGQRLALEPCCRERLGLAGGDKAAEGVVRRSVEGGVEREGFDGVWMGCR